MDRLKDDSTKKKVVIIFQRIWGKKALVGLTQSFLMNFFLTICPRDSQLCSFLWHAKNNFIKTNFQGMKLAIYRISIYYPRLFFLLLKFSNMAAEIDIVLPLVAIIYQNSQNSEIVYISYQKKVAILKFN